MERNSLEVINRDFYDFKAMLKKHDLNPSPISIGTLWVNVTRRCNQACVHCHVAASPSRTEEMSRTTIDQCLNVLASYDFLENVDITGGAPELNPHFDHFVIEARKLNKHVIVRHNFTVTTDGDPGTGRKMAYLSDFFAENQVEILASLPHYSQSYTDEIRGHGVFEKSIEGIRRFNELGYGQPSTGLVLNLVYNCDGPLLPTDRVGLEERFRQELMSRYDLVFNRLFCVTNVPINRFGDRLKQSDSYVNYMDRLVSAFSPAAAMQIDCRSLVSVGYDGYLYDCDFNQMLDMKITDAEPLTIFNFNAEALLGREIRFGPHCFGCTAGGGGS
jgi:radical SAM/Cys-rich protein